MPGCNYLLQNSLTIPIKDDIFYIIRYKEQKDQSLAVAVGHQHILVHLVPDMGSSG